MQNSVGNLANLMQSVLLQNGFAGEFHVDKPARLLNATDNSIYEVLPSAVAIPSSFADIKLLIDTANQEPFNNLYFCPRGGGTGTNGQSLTDGIVIDFSKFMNQIVEFDPVQKTVTVEPGVILDDLNRFLLPHGLFFAPNVSTSNRATIGGMIATDAAGKGSLIYGKTADHVLGLTMVLADGVVLDTIDKNYVDDNLENIASKVSQLLTPIQNEIQQRFPPLKRPLSGYNIRQCFKDDNTFDLNYLIAGSEGTLGLVTKAKLKLLSIPKFKRLIVVHYPSFAEALRDAEFLIQFEPLAIEAIDEKVQKSAQTLPNWPQLAKMLNSEGKTYISNFIEFVADDLEELTAKIAKLQAALDSKSANYVVIEENTQISQLWSIRSLAVGLAGKMPGKRKPVAFVEDAIVPPQHLADFVADLESELNKLQLNYAMYGHVDVGCIHVRPALDMQENEDRQQIRPITEMVIKLLDKYQGILWGEHGKGYRGEFVPDVFGPVLYPVLCKIKQLFDPRNRFNPGKLTSPNSEEPLQRIELVAMRGQFDQHISAKLQEQFSPAMICNGNGACFNKEPNNVMCPSYKITKDRIHSPKGRAMLVKEWLRKKTNAKNDEHKLAADQAFDALSGCLGCKGCAGKCPTQVSIPDLRANFLYNYHKLYKKRSLRDLMLGHVESALPYVAKISFVWQLLNKTGLAGLFGINNPPQFSSKSLGDIIKEYKIEKYSKVEQIATLKVKPVVIFTDSFTGLLNNQVLQATIELLHKFGYNPYIIEPKASGKALIVGGFLDQFKKTSSKLANLFNPLFAANIPVVSLENTIALMFRDEVKKFAIPFKGQVLTLAELVNQISSDQQLQVNNPEYKFRLLPHCTEQAVAPAEALLWQKIYTQNGIAMEIKNLGCCGMAGTYGHLKENEENSRGLFTLNWQSTTVSDDGIINLASGFSCRTQVAHLENIELRHPIQVLNDMLVGLKH